MSGGRGTSAWDRPRATTIRSSTCSGWAPPACSLSSRSGTGARPPSRVFVVGYLIQSLYTLLEMGDGDLFLLPLPLDLLRIAEEFAELAFLAAYLAGFGLVHSVQTTARRQGGRWRDQAVEEANERAPALDPPLLSRSRVESGPRQDEPVHDDERLFRSRGRKPLGTVGSGLLIALTWNPGEGFCRSWIRE